MHVLSSAIFFMFSTFYIWISTLNTCTFSRASRGARSAKREHGDTAHNHCHCYAPFFLRCREAKIIQYTTSNITPMKTTKMKGVLCWLKVITRGVYFYIATRNQFQISSPYFKRISNFKVSLSFLFLSCQKIMKIFCLDFG